VADEIIFFLLAELMSADETADDVLIFNIKTNNLVLFQIKTNVIATTIVILSKFLPQSSNANIV
jgi:hypothetical protein